MDIYPNIYPQVNQGFQDETDGGDIHRDKIDYRLSEIARLRDYLERESRERTNVYRKYNKAIRVLDGIDLCSAGISVAMGCATTAMLVSVVGSAVNPILLGCSAAAGLLGAATKVSTRNKAQKHDQIRQLADAKFNSISVLVSKALEDGCVSQEQFKGIVDEFARYNDLKTEIREKAANKKKTVLEVDESKKQDYIEMGRAAARKFFMKKIGAGSS